jgi:Flp pilus assembly pilin Flp
MNKLKAMGRRACLKPGQTLAEYGLVLGLVSLVVVGVMMTMSGEIGNTLGIINANLLNARDQVQVR